MSILSIVCTDAVVPNNAVIRGDQTDHKIDADFASLMASTIEENAMDAEGDACNAQNAESDVCNAQNAKMPQQMPSFKISELGMNIMSVMGKHDMYGACSEQVRDQQSWYTQYDNACNPFLYLVEGYYIRDSVDNCKAPKQEQLYDITSDNSSACQYYCHEASEQNFIFSTSSINGIKIECRQGDQWPVKQDLGSECEAPKWHDPEENAGVVHGSIGAIPTSTQFVEECLGPDSVVFQKINVLLSISGSKNTKFRLQHESLGEIAVEVSSDISNNIDLKIIVPNVHDIKSLENQKPNMADMLKELGFQEVNIEFTNSGSNHHQDSQRDGYQWRSYEIEFKDVDEVISGCHSISYKGYSISPVAVLLDILV